MDSPFYVPETVSYCYDSGPTITDLDKLFGHAEGELIANCQLFMHILLEEMGIAVPKPMRSAELFCGKFLETQFLVKVDVLEEVKSGDIFFFQKPGLQTDDYEQLKTLHVAVCTDTEPLKLMHVHRWTKEGRYTRKQQACSTWGLDDFMESTHYNVLYGIRRVQH